MGDYRAVHVVIRPDDTPYVARLDLVTAQTNVRDLGEGWRVVEYVPAERLRGAVEAIREAERLVSGALEPGAIGRPVREFTRGEMADLEMALASLRAVSDASPRIQRSEEDR